MAVFQLRNRIRDLFDLCPEETFLPFRRNRDLLKLGMPDDHSIVIACSDPGAELLPVFRFKIPLAGHQQFCAGIQAQEFIRPLECQVIRHHEKCFLGQAQPFTFHGRCCHLEGFTRADFVCQQSIATVQHMGNRAELMFPEFDIRVHPHEMNMGSVVFPGAGGIEQLVVFLHQLFPAPGVPPYPVPEGILDGLLLLLGQCGFLLVQYPALFTVRVLHGVIDPNVLQVQGFLQDLISIRAVCAVGHIAGHIVVAGIGFARDPPFRRIWGKHHLDTAAEIIRCFKSLIHELPDDVRVQPGCAETDINLRSVQILRLRLFQCSHVGLKERIAFRRDPGKLQLVPHISGQVFIRCLPAFINLNFRHRILEDDSRQLRDDFPVFPRRTKQLRHIRQVHPALLTDGNRQRLARRVHLRHLPFRTDGALREHVRLALQFAVLVDILQRTEQIIGRILGKCLGIGPGIDDAVFRSKSVIDGVQLPLFCCDLFLRIVVHLVVDQLIDDLSQGNQAFYPALHPVVQVYRAHDGIFPEENLPGNDRIGKVLHVRVCRDGIRDIPEILLRNGLRRIAAVDMRDRFF